MIAAVRLGGEYGQETFTIVDLADLPLALSRKWSLAGGYVVTNPRSDESASLHRDLLSRRVADADAAARARGLRMTAALDDTRVPHYKALEVAADLAPPPALVSSSAAFHVQPDGANGVQDSPGLAALDSLVTA